MDSSLDLQNGHCLADNTIAHINTLLPRFLLLQTSKTFFCVLQYSEPYWIVGYISQVISPFSDSQQKPVFREVTDWPAEPTLFKSFRVRIKRVHYDEPVTYESHMILLVLNIQNDTGFIKWSQSVKCDGVSRPPAFYENLFREEH